MDGAVIQLDPKPQTLPEIRAAAKRIKDDLTRKAITSRLDAGMSVAQIAGELDTDRCSLYNVMLSLGIYRPQLNTRKLAEYLTEQEMADVQTFRDNGYTIAEAMKAINRPDLAGRAPATKHGQG